MEENDKLIELRELRIGNILSYDGKLVHVTNLDMDIDDEYQESIFFCFLGKSTNEMGGWNREKAVFRRLQRISLTPEILKNCGFQKHDDNCFYLKWMQTDFIIFNSKTPVAIANNVPDDAFYTFINGVIHLIKYLHQLQNLYFALTGKELKYTPG